jgi:hypothetical protein
MIQLSLTESLIYHFPEGMQGMISGCPSRKGNDIQTFLIGSRRDRSRASPAGGWPETGDKLRL